MITFHSKGDFGRSLKYLNKLRNLDVSLEKYAARGVSALQKASPKDSGLMTGSWGYEIRKNNKSIEIIWTNSDIEGGYNVAVLVQYGHATKNGKFVKGIDYINPAMRPLFDEIAEEVWKEVNRL